MRADGCFLTLSKTIKADMQPQQVVYLYSDNPFPSHEAQGLHVLPHNGLCCQGHEVHAQCLGYEGEGAGDSDVALDHF